jgi:hypothetical protein
LDLASDGEEDDMRRFTAIALLSMLFASSVVEAAPPPPAQAAAPNIRTSIASVRFERGATRDAGSTAQAVGATYPAHKVGAALALGFMGMLAGGWVGGKLECGHGADSGIKGAFIGAPIGAVVGAIAGYNLAR